ncbi:hypothetical protein KR018_010915, partial [Drosophila ironensis]
NKIYKNFPTNFEYFLVVFDSVRAQCVIPSEVLGLNYLAIYRVQSIMYHLTTNVVPVGAQVELICSGQNNRIILTCPNNFNLPRQDCANPLKPVMELAYAPKIICPLYSTLYSVGYRYDNQFIELYQTCYNDLNHEAVLTSHEVSYSTATAARCCDFVQGGVLTADQLASYNSQNQFARFNALLGPQQSTRYIKSGRTIDIAYQRGHLVPNNDYPFKLQQKATFLPRNIFPQSKDNNIGKWKIVEKWIKDMSITRPIHVCTGTMGVLKLYHDDRSLREMSLYGQGQIRIPKWIYKIVDRRYVVLSYNDQFANRVPLLQGLCVQGVCPNLNFAGANGKGKNKGYSFCCDYNTFIQNVVPNLFGYC